MRHHSHYNLIKAFPAFFLIPNKSRKKQNKKVRLVFVRHFANHIEIVVLNPRVQFVGELKNHVINPRAFFFHLTDAQ